MTAAPIPAEITVARRPPETDDVRFGQRARAHRTQIAAQDVDELRELVEAGRPEHAADAGDPPVAHRSKLQDLERPARAADPDLPEDNRSAILQQDGRGRHDHHRPEEHQSA